ncbi:MAG TPA: hypothetical protein VN699_01635 [Pirellulales bacterium]|nr:hypothetical protein [Pirellulales bacterium]
MTARQILNCLEERLATAVPLRVRAMEIIEPVYCLRIWYFGTDVLPEGRTPSLMLAKEAWWQQMLAEKGEKAPYYIWCADEIVNAKGMAYSAEITDSTVTEMVAEWYDELPDRDLPDDNDLVPLQRMVQRVAAKLNQVDWSKYAAVTDDFVVVAADGSHIGVGGDYGEMLASVSPERLDRFRSRQLLGTDTWWTLE